jgi:flavin reductase (DIM6/NTAB) family NADH-FMN oxidoreductase RutF
MTEAATTKIDPGAFRRILGHYPTGVAIVTAIGSDGQPVGMAVGTFTSVSLDPPLVGFLPAKTSTTWPKIEASGSFCINVLSAQQEALSRSFSRSGTDKFADVAWAPSPLGAPILTDALAWIDCELFRVDEAGDHLVVLGTVGDMRLQTGSGPLVFFRGGYGAFHSGSLVTGDPHGDLAVPLRIVDLARPELEQLTERTKTQCAVTALVGDQIVVLAVAGATTEDRASGTFIGGRVPAIPPFGTTFMAWEPSERVAAWTAMAPADEAEHLLARLDSVRRRGMTVSLEGGGVDDWKDAMSMAVQDGKVQHEVFSGIAQTFDPQDDEPDSERVRNLHVPVLGPDGRAGVLLNVGGFSGLNKDELAELIAGVKSVAGRISRLAGGGTP